MGKGRRRTLSTDVHQKASESFEKLAIETLTAIINVALAYVIYKTHTVYAVIGDRQTKHPERPNHSPRFLMRSDLQYAHLEVAKDAIVERT